MTDVGAIEERSPQLVMLEEELFVAGYHQNVANEQQKVWLDRHIQNKHFQVEGLVLLYDTKFLKHVGKMKTHWMGLLCCHPNH